MTLPVEGGSRREYADFYTMGGIITCSRCGRQIHYHFLRDGGCSICFGEHTPKESEINWQKEGF